MWAAFLCEGIMNVFVLIQWLSLITHLDEEKVASRKSPLGEKNEHNARGGEISKKFITFL